MTTQILTDRKQRARERAVEMNVRLQRAEHGYTTASQSADDTIYHIRQRNGEWTCTCPGFTYHGETCKHTAAAELREEKESPVTQEMVEMVSAILSGKAA